MRRLLSTAVLLTVLAVAGGAQAQQYKWVDGKGRTVYGDTPPPGVKAWPLRAPSGPAPATAQNGAQESGSKAARKGPLTPVEQEQEFRKRQLDAGKAREKADQDAKQSAALQENCRNAQEMVRTLQSGQRVQRTSPSGERYYLDDAAVAAEVARAQKVAEDSCK